MGLLSWIAGWSRTKVPPTIQQGQLHQLDQIDREQRHLNTRRIALEGELSKIQSDLATTFEWEADDADLDRTQCQHQPEYYTLRINGLQNIQLGITTALADIEARLTRLRAERMALVEKMNAPAESDSPAAVAEDQPTT